MKIYAISGLGADRRVFRSLKLDAELIPLDWIQPRRNEAIEDYALRMCDSIDFGEEFAILGVSFGGLVAVEMSKHLHPGLTILISSAETKYELSPLLRLVGRSNLVRILPAKAFDPPRPLAHFLFGTPEKRLLNEILDDTDLAFTKWAISEMLNWKNETRLPDPLIISGSRDKLMPVSKREGVRIVEGGEHFMIVDRAGEISGIINEKLRNLPEY